LIRAFTSLFLAGALACSAQQQAHRVVILQIDGLNADLLYRNMRQKDPASGKPRLPWFAHVFNDNGAVFENFYTRGISLSAPSWSMLNTGRHAVIRGNVEYDRYTGEVYDYLNFFPFYLDYAKGRKVDMPGVEVLDSAGIPILADSFRYSNAYQSPQLFKRGVRWQTLEHSLGRQFSRDALLSMIEGGGRPSLEESLEQQTESELDTAFHGRDVMYLDFFTGRLDHEAHATSQPQALYQELLRLDGLVGRIWIDIQKSPLADQTIFVVVSDHGMNNVQGIVSQTFSLPDLFNSLEGGAHHVVTDRYELSDYKLKGLNPLVRRVITPSTSSFYLAQQAAQYPTAWLDIDGNERAAVHLRNSDLNEIHILLIELAKRDLQPEIRRAASEYLRTVIDRHRAAWTETADDLDQELAELSRTIEVRREIVAKQPKKWTQEQVAAGDDKEARRLGDQLRAWDQEYASYGSYVSHLLALLAFNLDSQRPPEVRIADLVPERSLGDNNSICNLQHYVVGLSPGGLVLDASGNLDPERSFRHVNNFEVVSTQRVLNNPQPALSPKPIDFIASALPDIESHHSYWLYGDDTHQLMILVDVAGNIAVRPIAQLQQDQQGKVSWFPQVWAPGFPLHLFEDPELRVPVGTDRAAWLSAWHSEREWMDAVHRCKYSNGVIGITEELSPVADNVPGTPGEDPLLLRFERRRRELVQADFHVFAADHWNFNVRFPNPGGNHGSFFRISTHSVWMMAGAGIPVEDLDEPYDSLSFASTILSLAGHTAPLPNRAVPMQWSVRAVDALR
jgi:hypothetical protein